MKKLCRKSAVHPMIVSAFISILPATIFVLTGPLSADDKEVVAYLMSCSSIIASLSNRKGGVDHAPRFECECFMCYRQYWARWDSSPNRQLIHKIIEAYEDVMAKTYGISTEEMNSEKDRRDKNNESAAGEVSDSVPQETDGEGSGEEEGEGEERGSVRRLVSFVGEKMWSAWG